MAFVIHKQARADLPEYHESPGRSFVIGAPLHQCCTKASQTNDKQKKKKKLLERPTDNFFDHYLFRRCTCLDI